MFVPTVGTCPVDAGGGFRAVATTKGRLVLEASE